MLYLSKVSWWIRWLSVLVILFTTTTTNGQETSQLEVRIPEHAPGTYQQYQYFYTILTMALQVTESDYDKAVLVPTGIEMIQNRQLVALERNYLDVIWSVTSQQREQKVLPVRSPLIKGLFGYRLFLINQKNRFQFAPDRQLGEIKKLTAVQGFDWPDTEILRENGFNVATSDYTNGFRLLVKGFVDYFPRSVTEIQEEVDRYQSTGIEIAPNHGLYYPSAFYFFVASSNQALQQRIERGLSIIKQSGEFERLFMQQDFIQKALILLKNKKMHELDVKLSDATREQIKLLPRLNEMY